MDATQVAALCHLPKDESGLGDVRFRRLVLTHHGFNLRCALRSFSKQSACQIVGRAEQVQPSSPVAATNRETARKVEGARRDKKAVALLTWLLFPIPVRPGYAGGLRSANRASTTAGWG